MNPELPLEIFLQIVDCSLRNSESYKQTIRWRHLNRQFYHSSWINCLIYQGCCRMNENKVSGCYAPVSAFINGDFNFFYYHQDMDWNCFIERLPITEMVCDRPISPPSAAEIASSGFEGAYYKAILGHSKDKGSMSPIVKARFPCFHREVDQQLYLKCLRRDLSISTKTKPEGLHPIVILCLLFREDGPFSTDKQKEDDAATNGLVELERIFDHYLAGTRVPLSVYRYICGLIPSSLRVAQRVWAHDLAVLNRWSHPSKHEHFERRIILECFHGIVDSLKEEDSSRSRGITNDAMKVIDWLCTSDGLRDIAPRILAKAAFHENLPEILSYVVEKHGGLPNADVHEVFMEDSWRGRYEEWPSRQTELAWCLNTTLAFFSFTKSIEDRMESTSEAMTTALTSSPDFHDQLSLEPSEKRMNSVIDRGSDEITNSKYSNNRLRQKASGWKVSRSLVSLL